MPTTKVGCIITLTSKPKVRFRIARIRTFFLRFLARQVEEDGYIQTYKVGRKKQELDNLVMKGMKRFSLIGV